jgi:hypothetical protein
MRRWPDAAERLAATLLLGMVLEAAMACPLLAQCGQPTKEYVRLGGRVIAIENYAQLAAPTFNPPSGTIASSSVTVTATTGSVIYYTTDGSAPSCALTPSPSNTLALTVTSGETVKAFAAQAGAQASSVSSATYTIGTPAATVTFTPASWAFASQVVGTTSAPQAIALTNTTGSNLPVGISATGDFAVATNTCGSSMGASCTVSVTFTPTAAGARTGQLLVADSLPNSPQTVSLSGTGGTAPPAQISFMPSSGLSFGNQTVNQTSQAQTLTITNSAAAGSQNLVVGQPTATDGEFVILNNTCGTVTPQGSCTMQVTFTPNAAGSHIATLSIPDNAPGAPHSVALGGAGYVAQLAAPTFSIPTLTTVPAGTSVTITAPAGASILYTSDGSNPLTSPTAHLVGSPFSFPITSTVFLGAVSRQTGVADSTVASALYFYLTSGPTVSPMSALLTSGQFIPFTMSASLSEPWNNANDYIVLNIGTGTGVTPNTCTVEYWPQTFTVYLTDGTNWASGAIGSNTVLSNSLCTLNLAGSAAVVSNTVLSVTVPAAFSASYAGWRGLYLEAFWQGVNTGGYSLGWDTIQANSVTVTPATVSLNAGQQQQFTANTAVNWSVSPPVGPISGAGLYSAPGSIASQQVVTVTATSQADATKFANAAVTLLPGVVIPADLHLTNLVVSSGSATYQATHSITADTNVVIGGTASVTFTAGTIITLDPGFHATAGGSGMAFHAVIQ